MKKFVVLILLIGVYFGLAKWAPKTVAPIQFWKKKVPAAAQTPAPAAETSAPAPAAGNPAPAAAEPAPKASEPAAAASAKPPAAANVDTAAQVIVLCYHRMEGAAGGALSITTELFEEHLQTLKQNGISVISMQDFLAWKRKEKSIPAKSCIITIDDGYVSAYEVARPILKKHGVPWTYFIYTKYVGSGGKSVSWEQLAELRDEGVEIGSHTISHINLRTTAGKSPEAYDAWLREEIIGSKKIIEQKLGIKCAVFAYPEGKFDQKVLEVVKDSGYDASFSVYGQRNTHSGPNDRIGRYAYYTPRPQDMQAAFSFAGPVSSGAETPETPSSAAGVMVTQPMQGEVTTNLQPTLKANLSSLGDLDPASVKLRLSGVGAISGKYDTESKTIEARPPKPLAPGDYTAIVGGTADGKKVEAQWSFKVDPKGGGATPAQDELPPRKK